MAVYDFGPTAFSSNVWVNEGAPFSEPLSVNLIFRLDL